MPDLCPVCHLSASVKGALSGRDASDIDCPRCGSYSLTNTALACLPSRLWSPGKVQASPFAVDGPLPEREDRVRIAALSHMIRRAQGTEVRPALTSNTLDEVLRDPFLPKPQQQLDSLVTWLGERLIGLGDAAVVDPWTVGGSVGAPDNGTIDALVRVLVEDGLATAHATTWNAPGGPRITNGAKSVSLTMKGWQRYEDLSRAVPSGFQAFMAMQFGDSELDGLVNNHIRDAVRQTGFQLTRLDDQPRAGLIDDRLRVEIRNSRFLIADLTHANNGAYWEAGFAEGCGKPVIYTCRQSAFADGTTRLHFDTNHHLTVFWDSKDPAPFVAQLKATIRATIPEARQRDD